MIVSMVVISGSPTLACSPSSISQSSPEAAMQSRSVLSVVLMTVACLGIKRTGSAWSSLRGERRGYEGIAFFLSAIMLTMAPTSKIPATSPSIQKFRLSPIHACSQRTASIFTPTRARITLSETFR